MKRASICAYLSFGHPYRFEVFDATGVLFSSTCRTDCVIWCRENGYELD